ncbi:MAG: EamA family transporter, partial [Gammaproteobacteria bacterium]
MPLDADTRATIRLLIGAVLISFSAVFVTVLSVPPTVSAFYRLLFGGGFLLLYILATKRSLARALTGLLAIFLAAAFFAADLWTWHRSIIYVGPGLATMLANFQVFFLALAGVLFFGERWRWQLMVAIPMALLGLGMIVGFDWRILTVEYRTGIWLGLLTAVFYAAYILSLRRARTDGRRRSAVADLALVSLISAAVLGVGAVAAGDSLALSWSEDLGILLAYALVAQVFGWLLIAHSLAQVPASRV